MRNFIIYVLFYSLLILVSGCTSSGKIVPLQQESSIKYSIIFIIHADANYLYHDKNGIAMRADEKVLKEAMQTAEQASDGEIFIFHQKPERKFLWLFRQKSREFLLYRNGKPAGTQAYSPSSDSLLFSESNIYQTYRVNSRDSVPVFFLYFGHEIPAENGRGYHHSQPGVALNVPSFAEGMGNFIPDNRAKFSLAALSTCNNGTPQIAAALADKTDYLLASPQNLHLSHLDTKALSMLENDVMPAGDQLGEAIAEDTYHRLTESVFTGITLALYDLNQLKSYVTTFAEIHDAKTDSLNRYSVNDNTDCSRRDFFHESDYTEGVKSWFWPPQFGPDANRTSHSGWGCRPGD